MPDKDYALLRDVETQAQSVGGGGLDSLESIIALIDGIPAVGDLAQYVDDKNLSWASPATATVTVESIINAITGTPSTTNDRIEWQPDGTLEWAPGGGGGSPIATTTADIPVITFSEEMATIDFTATNSAVDTGIAVPANTKTILINYGASTTTATAGIDLPWFSIPIEEFDRLDPVDAGDPPTQGNARFTRTWRDDNITTAGATMARQVWYGKGNNGNIFVFTDNTGWDIHPFRARFEIHTPLSVVTEVTGGGGGSGNYFVIPSSSVGGTGNAVTLTTGQGLTALTHGMLFYFVAQNANTGTVTVDIDGIWRGASPALQPHLRR